MSFPFTSRHTTRHDLYYEIIRQKPNVAIFSVPDKLQVLSSVDLKGNVQSIDPNSAGLWFLILRPDFSQL